MFTNETTKAPSTYHFRNIYFEYSVSDGLISLQNLTLNIPSGNQQGNSPRNHPLWHRQGLWTFKYLQHWWSRRQDQDYRLLCSGQKNGQFWRHHRMHGRKTSVILKSCSSQRNQNYFDWKDLKVTSYWCSIKISYFYKNLNIFQIKGFGFQIIVIVLKKTDSYCTT